MKGMPTEEFVRNIKKASVEEIKRQRKELEDRYHGKLKPYEEGKILDKLMPLAFYQSIKDGKIVINHINNSITVYTETGSMGWGLSGYRKNDIVHLIDQKLELKLVEHKINDKEIVKQFEIHYKPNKNNNVMCHLKHYTGLDIKRKAPLVQYIDIFALDIGKKREKDDDYNYVYFPYEYFYELFSNRELFNKSEIKESSGMGRNNSKRVCKNCKKEAFEKIYELLLENKTILKKNKIDVFI